MSDADEVVSLVKALRPTLAGRPKEIQGAALADLLAIWLASHVVRGDPAATKRWHDKILKLHLTAVRKLVPIAYQELIEPRPDA